jgi:hypothetical protein
MLFAPSKGSRLMDQYNQFNNGHIDSYALYQLRERHVTSVGKEVHLFDMVDLPVAC